MEEELPDLDATARDELHAAAVEVQQMDDEEFAEFFRPVAEQYEQFDPETDVMMLSFELNPLGIDRWRMQHLDTSREGTIYDMQKRVTHFEEREDKNDNKIGINTINIDLIKENAPSFENLQTGLAAAFLAMEKARSSHTFFANPSLALEIYEQDGSVKVRLSTEDTDTE